MVPKNLIIFLVLLWTMRQGMAKRSIKAKYRETGKINYSQENDITVPHRSVHLSNAMSIE